MKPKNSRPPVEQVATAAEAEAPADGELVNPMVDFANLLAAASQDGAMQLAEKTLHHVADGWEPHGPVVHVPGPFPFLIQSLVRRG